MNQLNGRLAIRSLANVGSEKEAAEARLVDKQYIKELVLQWRQSGIGMYSLILGENEVLECLRPHSRIECLKIHGFGGDRLPSWFKPGDLLALRRLELSYFRSLSIPCFADRTQADQTHHTSSSISRSNVIVPFAFTRLTNFRVYECYKMTNLEQFLTPEKLPSIMTIVLENCRNLASVPVYRFVDFVYLQDLKIISCHKLECPREMVLPPSLQRLCIVHCYELERSFPACLENLISLTLLQLAYCHSVKCIPLKSIGSNKLKCLDISNCRELSSIGGLEGLASIQHVQLSRCPNLTEVQLPFEKKELQTEGKEVLKFLYTDPFLR